jgi:PHD/YefM family antitoxin component YafN of YafNO toxin-antitoxin module
MKKVTSADMARRFSAFCDMALNEPVVVTKNGRDRLVLLGIDEYNHLQDLVSESRKNSKRESRLSEEPRIVNAKDSR